MTLPYLGIVSCGQSNRPLHEPGRVRERQSSVGPPATCGPWTVARCRRTRGEAYKKARFVTYSYFSFLFHPTNYLTLDRPRRLYSA